MPAAPLGVYVHVPFCRERCAYCDFAIVTGREDEAEAWADGIVREAAAAAARHGARDVTTVHFGGGTPSRVSPGLLTRCLDGLAASFALGGATHVSLEANPEDVTPARLRAWRTAGVRRLSLGVQALRDRALAALGRPGRADDGPRALDDARDAGIESVSADFIYGWPGQTAEDWETELAGIAGLGLDHASLYALELTGRTPLVRSIERGESPAPDDDLQAAMYERACERLPAAGLAQYEISNFARPGHESAHNVLYWTDADYVGLGPSAAGCVDGERRVNPAGLTAWRAALEAGGLPGRLEPYEPDRRAGEAIVFGLRLVAGVDLARVAARHGADAVARRLPPLEEAIGRGLVRRAGEDRVALTSRGRLLANEVAERLL